MSSDHDVWLGFGATVLGTVSVGHGAVVEAGAVAVRDVAPYQVLAGDPARVVSTGIPEHLLDDMLGIAWWDWPESLVTERAEWLTQLVGDFVRRCRAARVNAASALPSPRGEMHPAR